MNEIDVDEILSEYEDKDAVEFFKFSKGQTKIAVETLESGEEQTQTENVDETLQSDQEQAQAKEAEGTVDAEAAEDEADGEEETEDGEEELPTPAIDIEISANKLYAYITISQDPPAPYQVTVDQLYDVLAAAKVEYGVMLDKLDLIVANQEYPTHELIAVGKEMVPGIDAALKFLISTEMGGRPKDMGHYVDHRDLHLAENIKAGQILVRKIPAQEGEPGMSVHGQPIRAPRVKDVRLPAGKGTKISDTNPLELVAERDGFVRMDKRSFDRIVVEDVFQVKGDVDLSVGNLDIDGSIKILGSVREGFTVKATGNIQIQKRVEAASLEAGGNIEILGGIIGGKRGAVIKAKENVVVKFAVNTTIEAGENVTIADEALNCQVQADKLVVVGGTTEKSAGAIIGGTISAGQEISAINVGTEVGILTRLRVGQHSTLLQRRRNMQAEIKTLEKKLQEVEQLLRSLTKRQAERSHSQPDRLQQKTKLHQQQAHLQQQLQSKLEKAERAGLISSTSTVQTLEEEIKNTKATLSRVEESIETLKKRLTAKTSVSASLKNKKTLEQFQAAQENLVHKLTDLEKQLAQRSANPWGNLPWAERRDLERTQANLQNIQAQISSIEAENATDERIEQALIQLQSDRQAVEERLTIQKDELELLKQQIEALKQKPPQIVVSGELHGGTEIIINNRHRRITKDRHAVRLRLSESDAIIVVNLN